MDSGPPSNNPSIDIKHLPTHPPPVEEDVNAFLFTSPNNPPLQTVEELRSYVTQLQLARISDLERDRFHMNFRMESLHREFQDKEHQLKVKFQAKEQKWREEHEVVKKLVMAELKILLQNQNGSGTVPPPPRRESDSGEAAAELKLLKEKLADVEKKLKNALEEKEEGKLQIRDLTDEIAELKHISGECETNFRTELWVRDGKINQLKEEMETLKVKLNTTEQKKRETLTEIQMAIDKNEKEEEDKQLRPLKKEEKKEHETILDSDAENLTALPLLPNKVKKKKESVGAVEVTENQFQLVPSSKPPSAQCDPVEPKSSCEFIERSSSSTEDAAALKTENDEVEVEFLGEVITAKALVPVETGGPPKPATVVLSSKGPQVKLRDPSSLKKKFKCAKCPKRFLMFHELRHHMEKVHRCTRPYGSTGCSICGYIFNTKKQFFEHREQFHTGPGRKRKRKSKLATRTSNKSTRRDSNCDLDDPEYIP